MHINDSRQDRSEQTANAALLAIMLLIASGAALQIQNPHARTNSFSSRIAMTQASHTSAQDHLFCSEFSIEHWEQGSMPRAEAVKDSAPHEGLEQVADRARRNLPPPHRA